MSVYVTSPETIPPEYICGAPTHTDACRRGAHIMEIPVRTPCPDLQPDKTYSCTNRPNKMMNSACIMIIKEGGIIVYVCPICKKEYAPAQLLPGRLSMPIKDMKRMFQRKSAEHPPTPPLDSPHAPIPAVSIETQTPPTSRTIETQTYPQDIIDDSAQTQEYKLKMCYVATIVISLASMVIALIINNTNHNR